MTSGTTYDPPQPRGSWTVFATVAVPLAIVYLVTTFGQGQSGPDGLANAQTAFEFAEFGNVYLEDEAVMPEPWMVPVNETQAVSQYPPGAALLAVPLYALWSGEPRYVPWTGPPSRPGRPEALRVKHGDPLRLPPRGPGRIVAAITTAIAIGLTAVVFRRFTSTRNAIYAGFVAGLATGAWSVSTSQLWQHGPAMMWIAAGIVLSTNHAVWSGLSFGLAILTRPHTAFVAAGTGIGRSFAERSWKPALLIGAGAATGLAILLLYNYAVFGEATLSGGYASAITDNLASADLGEYARNLWGAMFDSSRGLFVYSPFIFVLIPGVVGAWRDAPSGVRGAAVGAVIYLLVQYKANRFSGGFGFFGYRYPLEALVGLAPLLYLSYLNSIKGRRILHAAFIVTVVMSIGIQAAGVVEIMTV